MIFTRAFFYNFRLFTNASEFVRLLTKRFSLTPPKDLLEDQLAVWSSRVLIPVRLRVYNVIKTWLETYFNFEQDAIIEKPLMEFATTAMNEAMPGPAKRMVELIKRTVSIHYKTNSIALFFHCTDKRCSLLQKVKIVLDANTHTTKLVLQCKDLTHLFLTCQLLYQALTAVAYSPT